MHTNEPTRHTTTINGNLYYNRRVPSHAQGAFGQQVRVRIKNALEADRLTRRLNDIWAEEDFTVSVDFQSLLAAITTKQANLSAISKEYVQIRGIQDNPTISSALLLAQLSGDMAIDAYGRQDARNFVQVLLQRGMRTTSVRRRLNCLSAVFNYAYAEYEIEGRNPFTRFVIPKEGTDRERRYQLPQGRYTSCMRLVWPLRGLCAELFQF